MECNICGSRKFRDMKERKQVRCADCGSLERTRLLWLYIERSGVLGAATKVMHFAPETGLSERIVEKVGRDNYFPFDYSPELYPGVPGTSKFDLTVDIENVESNSFDLIIHCHVLEHIPCTLAHTLFHLHRVLKPDGIHACIIPFSPGKWDESFDTALSNDARIKRFGQHDHMRRIGKLDVDKTIGKIVDIELYKAFDATKDFLPDILLRFNIPESHWYGLGIGTPLLLRKQDFRLK